MTTAAGDYRLADLERRISEIEKARPDVIADRVARLTERMDTLIKIGVSILLALVAATISFAFFTLQTLGH